ncbi:LLM class flavin-dependent oxidoreductase [Paucibacter sp. XJ19-41]|uniref:LLM class flavin-dependent oxidoreductase n=1 Tax=Paucibacter sp. XJ19-41 TaxID=2927824 RepID=UPI0023497806|nr:LLM class flavin-dependent oxidoreductase [Paucibacter sp. XJ19-41]MDC6167155.1 LLM class flavin-dependent oxidoreductase [Paucibacter sp. XJ19-41]
MKFSLFYEMQMSNDEPGTEARTFHEALEQAVLADQLGFHCVWAVEHHGLYEYAHSSAPEIFLSFVAARTERIRLGHGVTLTPHRFNHPMRIAERVATLDILSGGRVNWGSGKSSSVVEAKTFGIPEEDLHGQWEEALEMVPAMWRNEVFEWSSDTYKIPPVHIVPKPVQKPLPPMFGPTANPRSLQRVAELGLGALNFSMASFEDLKQKVDLYRSVHRAAPAPKNYAKNEHFCVTVNTCVLPDDDEACRHGFRGARFFRDSFAKYYFTDKRPPLGALEIDRDPLSPMAHAIAKNSRFVAGNSHGLSIIGDPAIARDKVGMFKAAGVDELILIVQLATIPGDVVQRGLRTFAEEVMPHFG